MEAGKADAFLRFAVAIMVILSRRAESAHVTDVLPCWRDSSVPAAGVDALNGLVLILHELNEILGRVSGGFGGVAAYNSDDWRSASGTRRLAARSFKAVFVVMSHVSQRSETWSTRCPLTCEFSV
jgi:hypothetical protein